ncbi:LCP family protein [Pseudarthrobacter sp. J1763]|uniref:LCP family protein n=1 Tax=Pseudarthrobacter sp. J1763 TaxID=3420445 RepID=UPI003D2AA756
MDETPSGRKKTGRTVLISFAAVVVIAALVAGGYVFSLVQSYKDNVTVMDSAFPEESTRPTATGSGDSKAVNVLLLGSDTRGAGVTDTTASGSSDQRSDTMILVHIPADRKHIYGISIMRDLWVDIPGHGQAKMNAALAFGGIPLVVQTVEQLLKSRIDHVAIVDFEAFKGVTEALGGIEVNVKEPFTAGQFNYPAGKQTLSGDKALAFARERHAFTDGDYQRVRNQQALIKGVIAKLRDKGTLSNPGKLQSLVSTLSPYLTVDKGLDAGTIASLGVSVAGVGAADTKFFTLPTGGVGTSADGQSIVLLDETGTKAVSDALVNDKLDEYVATTKVDSGN